jgi:hypothetical protein
MPTFDAYDYAVVRVVPCIQRGEFLNVGVILFCRTQRFLEARIDIRAHALHMLAPQLDLPAVQQQLDLIPRICAGGSEAGPIGELPQPERFHWLVAPRSTIIQPSTVHGGLCVDAAATLDHLLTLLVRVENSTDAEQAP